MNPHVETDPLDAAAALIPRVLEERAVFPVYQPIMDLATGTVVAVEALTRGPAGSPVESPAALFAAATRAGLLAPLDKICFTRALEVARDGWDVVPPLVFVNVEPAALDVAPTPELLAVVRSERFRVVAELTERALAAHPAGVLSIANLANQDGNAIALDDVGTDPLSLAFLPLVEPDAVKLDMHLLRNPNAPGTIETAAVVSGYAERSGAVVIAEGIETEEDLTTAQALGARWGQGWLFGHPGPLKAIAGWPVNRHARLRPTRPDLCLPSGTPFRVAAMRNYSRPGDQSTVDGLTDHLLFRATRAGSPAVVLAACPDPAVGRALLPRLASVADTAAYVGIVGTALEAGTAQHRVRVVAVPVDGSADTETVLAVVAPHSTVALCVRPGPGDTMDFVLTHDPELVHTVARMLLWRLDTASPWLHPAGGLPRASPVTAAHQSRTSSPVQSHAPKASNG
jgi:EAL domain-containing protein (putative c-di-GMP-specific phosphodiesterase class I)